MPRPELPTSSNPNSSRVRRNKKGKVVQRRYYGGDGKAIKNVDFEAHHGSPNPHVHDWDWTADPPRQPPRLPKKGRAALKNGRANIVQYKDYVAGWLASSISDRLDLLASAPESLPYALITCLDSDTNTASLLSKSLHLRSVAHLARTVGTAFLLPTAALFEANGKAPFLFFGFDEVWFFPNDQVEPKTDSAWIVGPRRIDRKTIRKLGPWMTNNNCLLGLGDGDGLNIVIKDGGMAKHLIGHSLTQPQPVLSGEME